MSETALKAFTPLDSNVQMSVVKPFILMAQDMYLQNILGTHFYETLQQQIYNYQTTGSASSFSPYYQDLLNQKIEPYMIQCTLMLALPSLEYKLKNKGIMSGAAEPREGKNADLKDLQYLEGKYNNYVEFYQERLRRELNIFTWKYPDYVNFAVQQNMFPARRPAYSSGIVIPRAGSKLMNQQYGRALYNQGDSLVQQNGIDMGMEMYGPSLPKP